MTDASLPDRVEAAPLTDEQLINDLRMYARFGYAWMGQAASRLETLAAADACEAERNPNTTDDPYVRCEYCGRWTWGFERRPVSSEDVHREAAE